MNDLDRVLRSNLKLRHLQLLVALDEFRHIGRVAERLSLTQPAVSKMLAEIEKMFGLELFIRSTKGTEPTAYGEAIIRFARAVQADYDKTCDELGAVASGAAGRVNIGAMVVVMPMLLSHAIETLKRHSPHSTALIEEGDLKRLLPKLRTGELDLIVGRLEPGYAAPDLATEPLYDEEMCLVCSPEHPAAQLESPDWKDLVDDRWVVPPPWASSRVKLNQMFYKHGINPPSDLIETASFLAIFNAIQQRPAIGYVAGSVARHFCDQGLLYRLPIELPLEMPPVGIITIQGRRESLTLSQMLAALRSGAKELYPDSHH
ncbi:LysR family transcriptional regulator [Marinobacterium lutimaris]|uniref:DNA-binding transcriptional regulator, LysR family n=1 Tax=Marinobacterium lutimaris TaxID=568106 RepID=A0A1H6AU15_9GAMM|nr:LysR family transcriptional regulator [Marinobacterium lutimaris]SEG51882.1 DNA-binding transcriptional regulator, LysR family [Marinobacterium lutimaris]